MIRSLSLQRYGDSLLTCNASSLIVGEWFHLCLAGTMRWTKIDVTLVHCLFCWYARHIFMTLSEYVQVILQKADDFFLCLEVQTRPYLGYLCRISFDQLNRIQFLDNFQRLFFNYPRMVFFGRQDCLVTFSCQHLVSFQFLNSMFCQDLHLQAICGSGCFPTIESRPSYDHIIG